MPDEPSDRVGALLDFAGLFFLLALFGMALWRLFP